jgi:hypothetical protein
MHYGAFSSKKWDIGARRDALGAFFATVNKRGFRRKMGIPSSFAAVYKRPVHRKTPACCTFVAAIKDRCGTRLRLPSRNPGPKSAVARCAWGYIWGHLGKMIARIAFRFNRLRRLIGSCLAYHFAPKSALERCRASAVHFKVPTPFPEPPGLSFSEFGCHSRASSRASRECLRCCDDRQWRPLCPARFYGTGGGLRCQDERKGQALPRASQLVGCSLAERRASHHAL